jgi:hypothetical protein
MKYSEVGKNGTKRVRKKRNRLILRKITYILGLVFCFYSGILYAIYHDTIVSYIKESEILTYLGEKINESGRLFQ